MEKIYKREEYLSKIRGFYHDKMIKVITGIRRCGKSYLLKTIIEELKESGVNDKDIIYIEVSGRRTRIVVRRSKGQEEVFRVTKSLVEWERILPKEKFVRGNRRQILNLMYVVDINSQIELINEHKISIGETYQHRVWERFHEFQSGRKGVYFYTSR